MRIVADSHIPYLRGTLERLGEVVYLEPAEITPEKVREADVLLCRTRTHCDEHLLAGSRVRLVLTATIGYDHIDREWCEANGIVWKNCPGCNAQGVCDWVESAMLACGEFEECEGLNGSKVLGVVGVGHVGSLVVKMAERRGWRVVAYDPYVLPGSDFEQVAREADVITFHTPLTRDGEFPTYHMADERWLGMTKPHVLLLNAARGGVLDEAALLRSGRRCAIDCWENEPQLNRELLERCEIGTFHIAGYTQEGKRNASRMVLENLMAFAHRCDSADTPLTPRCKSAGIFDIKQVSDQLKNAPAEFEKLRENYSLR